MPRYRKKVLLNFILLICMLIFSPLQAKQVTPLSGDKDDLKLDGYNPFIPQKNETVIIRYSVEVDKLVTIRVYNLLGELIKTIIEDKDTPRKTNEDYSEEWDGTNDDGDIVASGVYIIMAEIGGTIKVEKVVLINQKR